MTGHRQVFLTRDMIYTLTTGTHANLITLYPLAYMATHTGIVSGTQTITLSGVQMTEETFANIDLVASYGKYCVSAANAIIFAVDGATVNTLDKAGDYIEGRLVDYNMNSITALGTDIYDVNSYTSDGTFLGEAVNQTLVAINTRIQALDAGLDPNVNGYTYHVVSFSKTP